MNMAYDKKFLGKLKSNYYNAKVLNELIKEKAYEIESKILAENEFYETDEIVDMRMKRGSTEFKPRRILNPDNTYMMDLDNELPRFIDLCYPEYVKAGIADSRGKGYCPDAESREILLEATKQLVDYAIDIIPNSFSEKEILRKAVRNITWRDKVLELILKLESDEVICYAE